MRAEFPSAGRDFDRARRRYRRFFFERLRSASGAIVSAEILSGLAESHVSKLRADLESAGYNDFHVILYVRDPADYYLSRTQQVLKSTTHDPSRLLSRVRDGPEPSITEQLLIIDPASFVYDFRRAAETWERVFPGRLVVRRFPGSAQDVVVDFAEVVEESIGVVLQPVSSQLNPTLSAEGMHIVERYRSTYWPDSHTVTPDTRRLVRYLEGSLADVPQTTPALRDDVAQVIRANHVADAKWIHERYGVDLGLRDAGPQSAIPRSSTYRVHDIVKSVDRGVVIDLLLRVAEVELSKTPTRPSLFVGIARRAYHALPSPLRPQGFVAWLKNLRGLVHP